MTPGGLLIKELNDLLDRLALSENRLNLILDLTYMSMLILDKGRENGFYKWPHLYEMTSNMND